MASFDSLPDDWVLWSDEADRSVLVFRPDVFDSQEFPAPCLPTIYLTHGRRSRRPGSERNPTPEDPWYVTLFLEPEVTRDPERFDSREEARAGALALATRFADGDIDHRGLYQLPREEYLAKLDELTGHD